MNTPQAPATAATGPTTQPNPHIRSVLAAPKGRRFNRARPYAQMRPPSEHRPSALLRLPAHDHDDPRPLPPWLARLQNELGPQDQVEPRADRVSVRRATPPGLRDARPSQAPSGAPAKKRKPSWRQRLRRSRPHLPQYTSIESARQACTVLGMLVTAYLLGLLG